MASHPLKTRSGFTLIELSIVLVIIGLLVGGVLVGKDLIEAASLRKQGSQIQEIVASVNTFRLKYNCVPGDCQFAQQLFGTAAGCPIDINSYSVTNSGTCNGNGDGSVGM